MSMGWTLNSGKVDRVIEVVGQSRPHEHGRQCIFLPDPVSLRKQLSMTSKVLTTRIRRVGLLNKRA